VYRAWGAAHDCQHVHQSKQLSTLTPKALQARNFSTQRRNIHGVFQAFLSEKPHQYCVFTFEIIMMFVLLFFQACSLLHCCPVPR
jgi:hypothetical protein